jgi:hypothetical protein
VARVAQDVLDPEVTEYVEKALSHLKGFTSLEDKHPLVECATFGDEIKGRGWGD